MQKWAGSGSHFGELSAITTDVSSLDDCTKAIQHIQAKCVHHILHYKFQSHAHRYGRIDVLVNNAGIEPPERCVVQMKSSVC